MSRGRASSLARIQRRRFSAFGALLLLILVGLYFALRGTGLFAVKEVKIVGLVGPSLPQVRQTLRGEASSMTTLEYSPVKLRHAVSQYPWITGLDVSTQLPHTMTITVHERLPIAVIAAGGRNVPVTGSGQLLNAARYGGMRLPLVPLGESAGSGVSTGTRQSTVTAAGPLAAIKTLGAAPYVLITRINSAFWTAGRGVVVQFRNGPRVYFGDAVQLAQKWGAATAILADPRSVGASYVDVTDPARPAAGIGVPGPPRTGKLPPTARYRVRKVTKARRNGASSATSPAAGTLGAGTAGSMSNTTSNAGSGNPGTSGNPVGSTGTG